MAFSIFCGHDVIVSGRLASRRETVSSGCRSSASQLRCYVFSDKPLNCGEEFSVSVIGVDPSSNDGLTFGMTSCDPSGMSFMNPPLPADPDALLDRPEYWVVIKDVLSGTSNCDEGDILTFLVNDDGHVVLYKNLMEIQRLMHIDKTLSMWPFLDINGRVTAIAQTETGEALSPKEMEISPHQKSESFSEEAFSISSVQTRPDDNTPKRPARPPVKPKPQFFFDKDARLTSSSQQQQQQQSSDRKCGVGASAVVVGNATGRHACSAEAGDECCLCWDHRRDCVIYRCGHVCVCYECGLELRETCKSSALTALCPICRQPIVDLIKIFKS